MIRPHLHLHSVIICSAKVGEEFVLAAGHCFHAILCKTISFELMVELLYSIGISERENLDSIQIGITGKCPIIAARELNFKFEFDSTVV